MTADIILFTSIALISKEKGAYGAVAQLFWLREREKMAGDLARCAETRQPNYCLINGKNRQKCQHSMDDMLELPGKNQMF